MKPTLQLRIGQQLSMTPQLQQAIRLLQLSSLDLQQEIQSALEKNPMLELQESEQLTSPPAYQEAERQDHYQTHADNVSDSHSNTPDVSREHQTVDSDTGGSEISSPETTASADLDVHSYETTDTEYEQDIDTWSNPAAVKGKENQRAGTGNEIEQLSHQENSLQEHLLWQMQLTPFTLNDRLIAMTIIDAINDDGYLTASIEDIYQTLKDEIELDVTEVESVLLRIQQFEPLGVGARNLSECLYVQLDKLPEVHPYRAKAMQLVKDYLPLLAKRDYPALKRHLHVSMDALTRIVQTIQQQNPRPGREIGAATSEYITPDVYVRKIQGVWVVELNPDCTPNLRINHHYAQMIRRADSSRDNQFLRTQLQEARWFLKSIENRNETLIKVTECIVQAQIDFLELGEIAMKPLILHQVAEKIGMHESTVSRITNQKYMHTPRGTFELKYFFSSHVSTTEGGECSATAIRALIKKFIAEENAKKPLSDEKLSQLLAEEGIQVARRTIAKYRESLTIPPSNERKKLF